MNKDSIKKPVEKPNLWKIFGGWGRNENFYESGLTDKAKKERRRKRSEQRKSRRVNRQRRN